MTEIKSMGWIERNAKTAAIHFHKSGVPPVNPFEEGSDGHKEWTRVYYEHGTVLGMAQAQAA